MTTNTRSRLRPKTRSGDSSVWWPVALLLVLSPGVAPAFALEMPDDPIGYVTELCGSLEAPLAPHFELQGKWNVEVDGEAEGMVIAAEEDGYIIELMRVPAESLKYIALTGKGPSRWTDGSFCWEMAPPSECPADRCLVRDGEPWLASSQPKKVGGDGSQPTSIVYKKVGGSGTAPETRDTNCTKLDKICDSSGPCCGALDRVTAEEPIPGTSLTKAVCRCKVSESD